MEIQYSKRLKLMHALCLAETSNDKPSTDLEQYDALASAEYLSCYVTFKACLLYTSSNQYPLQAG